VLSLCLLVFFEIYAQTWVPLLGGINGQARVLFSDSVSGKLYVGGFFASVDGRESTGIAAWSGIQWDTLNGGVGDNNPVRAILRYQNYIYVGGTFRYLYSSPYSGLVNGFTRWDGASFDSLNSGFRGAPFQFVEYNNLLYCVGAFDSVGGYYSPLAVAWDGNN